MQEVNAATFRLNIDTVARLPLAVVVPAQARAPVPAPPLHRDAGLAAFLLADGWLTHDQLIQLLADQTRLRASFAATALAGGYLTALDLVTVFARHHKGEIIDLSAMPPDAQLIDRIGVADCLRDRLLPCQSSPLSTLIAVSDPDDFFRHQSRLIKLFGPVTLAFTTARQIEDAVLAQRGEGLAQRAETRVSADESCRDIMGSRILATAAIALLFVWIVATLWPQAVILAAFGWAILTLLLTTGLKLAAAVATSRAGPLAPLSLPATTADIMPTVSIIVALYREAGIVPHLLRRLSRLDYPRAALDVVLVVEDDDTHTRGVLDRAGLPPWMRVVTAPAGQVRTKPRALNLALDQCRGTIIGIYDAEDAPDRDQIRKVVAQFQAAGPQVACLQGILDFYNPTTNWLSRCFTIEYAAWFRQMLPGLASLGLVLPLGGTTLFFRRAALEDLGGWDAHNVTEDADLGLRLARHGFRTDLIATTTREEANCRALPWIKQRSRWSKGYMITWLVHMRRPLLLLRQLGLWRFFGVQVLFLGSVSQALLAPLLWSFWVLPFGVAHPVAQALPPAALVALIALFITSEAISVVLNILALRSTPHRFSRLWVPTLQIYHVLGAFAAYKAAWELLTRPFYWDKTSHGHFDGSADP